MHYSRNVVLAIAPFLLGVHAQVDLDMDDVPNSCKAICKPIGELSDKCDVDLRSDNDADEHHLQNQCICTNQSFDVAKIAAMCADCMHQSQQNNNGDNDNDDDDDDDDNDDNDGDDHADSDDLEDIDGLLSTCGFASTTYNSASASAMLASVSVSADRPTDVSQLTTTIDGQNPGSGGAGGNGGNGGSMTTSMPGTMQTSMTSSMPTPTPTGGNGGNVGGGGGGSDNDNNNDNDSDNNNDNGSDNNDDNDQSGGAGGNGGGASTTPTAAGTMPTGNVIYAGGLAAAAYLMG